MRQLTKTEQKLIESLIDNDSTKSGLRLGDVLIKVYPIEYIEKNQIDEPFYQKTINICHRAEEGLEAKLYCCKGVSGEKYYWTEISILLYS